eukprot:scaffold447_cov307-Pinguiococcus_pyrenoidosus.AAC.57
MSWADSCRSAGGLYAFGGWASGASLSWVPSSDGLFRTFSRYWFSENDVSNIRSCAFRRLDSFLGRIAPPSAPARFWRAFLTIPAEGRPPLSHCAASSPGALRSSRLASWRRKPSPRPKPRAVLLRGASPSASVAFRTP